MSRIGPMEASAEERSKDEFFGRIAMLSEEMIAAHGKDFTMGAFVLAARWIAEGRMGPAGQSPPAN